MASLRRLTNRLRTQSGPIIILAHFAGCIAASGVMEWRLGFDKTSLWRFLLYPISIPVTLVVLPYFAWTSRRRHPELRGRGLSFLTTASVLMWIAYTAGAASMIVGLRLARF